MPAVTPVYRLPYLLGSDTGRHIAQTSEQLAKTLETTLQGRAVPVSAELRQILTRLDAVERAVPKQATGATGQNGYQLDPGSRLYTIGDLVMFSCILTRQFGIEGGGRVVANIPRNIAPSASLTFAGIASQGGAAGPVTLVLGTNGNIACWTASTSNRNLAFQTIWKKA